MQITFFFIINHFHTIHFYIVLVEQPTSFFFAEKSTFTHTQTDLVVQLEKKYRTNSGNVRQYESKIILFGRNSIIYRENQRKLNKIHLKIYVFR